MLGFTLGLFAVGLDELVNYFYFYSIPFHSAASANGKQER